MNKRGFFFTAVVLFLIILLLLISFQIRREMTDESIKTRIYTANNYIKSIERDASRVLYISGYRSLFAITAYFSSGGDYLDGSSGSNTPEKVFAEALFNGTMNNTLGFPADYLLKGTTISDWKTQVEITAYTIGINVTFDQIDPNQLKIFQNDSWNLNISIPLIYNASDPVSGVKWKRNTTISASIPLINTFEDPLYLKEFGQGCGNKIIKNDYKKLVDYDGTLCDTTNLSNFLRGGGAGSMYIKSTRAPSFLNRLKGNFSADPNGIESLRNSFVQGCTLFSGRSLVDFRYARADVCGSGDNLVVVSGMPWVYLCYKEATNSSLYNIPAECLSSV